MARNLSIAARVHSGRLSLAEYDVHRQHDERETSLHHNRGNVRAQDDEADFEVTDDELEGMRRELRAWSQQGKLR